MVVLSLDAFTQPTKHVAADGHRSMKCSAALSPSTQRRSVRAGIESRDFEPDEVPRIRSGADLSETLPINDGAGSRRN